MARFIADIPVNKPDDFIKFVSDDFLIKEGFQQLYYKNEFVWKKGRGIITAPQFIKLQYGQGMVHIEAWLKFAILPGVYTGEMGTDGFFGALPKSELKSRVNSLISLLNQPVNIPAPQMVGATVPQPGGYSQQPTPPYPPMQQPIPVVVHDPVQKATLSLIMGLVGMVAWLIPIIGIIVSIVGISSGSVGRKSSQRSKATAGLVLSIIALCLSVLNFVLAFILQLSQIAF